jgi:hypothetical protein
MSNLEVPTIMRSSELDKLKGLTYKAWDSYKVEIALLNLRWRIYINIKDESFSFLTLKEACTFLEGVLVGLENS